MGETREFLEKFGGPGRRWCALAQTWIIEGSCPACPHADGDYENECPEWAPEEGREPDEAGFPS